LIERITDASDLLMPHFSEVCNIRFHAICKPYNSTSVRLYFIHMVKRLRFSEFLADIVRFIN